MGNMLVNGRQLGGVILNYLSRLSHILPSNLGLGHTINLLRATVSCLSARMGLLSTSSSPPTIALSRECPEHPYYTGPYHWQELQWRGSTEEHLGTANSTQLQQSSLYYLQMSSLSRLKHWLWIMVLNMGFADFQLGFGWPIRTKI